MAKKELKENNTEKEIATAKSLILAPRITEKASLQSEANAYTFVVAKNATKLSLAKEIEKSYKVKPTAINIININGKIKFKRGAWGKTAGIKKAVVFLKKGDTINLTN